MLLIGRQSFLNNLRRGLGKAYRLNSNFYTRNPTPMSTYKRCRNLTPPTLRHYFILTYCELFSNLVRIICRNLFRFIFHSNEIIVSSLGSKESRSAWANWSNYYQVMPTISVVLLALIFFEEFLLNVSQLSFPSKMIMLCWWLVLNFLFLVKTSLSYLCLF